MIPTWIIIIWMWGDPGFLSYQDHTLDPNITYKECVKIADERIGQLQKGSKEAGNKKYQNWIYACVKNK